MNIGAPWPDLDEAEWRVLKMQRKLHQRATSDPGRRFDDLSNLVYDPAFLVVAWSRVRGNKGSRSAGVDGVAPFSILFGAGEFLSGLRDDLKARRFTPSPVREKMIPKASGKLRRLGIPTAADRVVQASLKLVLEPIFEADFKPCSYGFRPRRRAQDAIAEIHFLGSPPRNYEWVFEADIKACFDAPSHCPFRCWCHIEEGWIRPIHLDSQAFPASGSNVHGIELATLYTLQDRLARYAEGVGGFQHRQPARWGLVDEAAMQLIGHADAPRCSGRELLAGDEPVGHPAVDGGGNDAEKLGGLGDRDELAVGCLGRWLVPRNVPVVTKALDDGGREALPRGAAPDQQRGYTAAPAYHEVVELREFKPTRATDKPLSANRYGAFAKSTAYEGWERSLFAVEWFDSEPERAVANMVDEADDVRCWIRLHPGELPILWNSGGQQYNPDLIVIGADGTHWVVEVKMEKEMTSAEVQGKRDAARRWANYVTADDAVTVAWRYLLAAESDVKAAKRSWPALVKLAS